MCVKLQESVLGAGTSAGSLLAGRKKGQARIAAGLFGANCLRGKAFFVTMPELIYDVMWPACRDAGSRRGTRKVSSDA